MWLKGEKTRIVVIPYHKYVTVAYQEYLYHDKKLKDMLQVLPHTSEVSKIKKLNILSSFQEIEFASGATGQRIAQVLEQEG